MPDTRPDTRPNTSPDTRPDTRPSTSPDTVPDTGPDPRPNSRRSLRLGNDLGLLAVDDLLRLARTAKELGLKEALLTSGQRLMLPGLDADQDTALRREFAPLVVQGHDLVQACPGRGRCRFAKGDTLDMARRMADLLRSMDLPAKAKAGISGCANCCAESKVRDLGPVAGVRGWTVYFGGNAGKRPRVGDELGRELNDEQALNLARQALEEYARQARPGERTARFMERKGTQGNAQAVSELTRTARRKQKDTLYPSGLNS